MAKLTSQEVLDGLVRLYQAKQELAVLDDSLNAQAATIMAQAQASIAALKISQQAERNVVMAIIQTSETSLHKGK
jgi:hypothetical protein